MRYGYVRLSSDPEPIELLTMDITKKDRPIPAQLSVSNSIDVKDDTTISDKFHLFLLIWGGGRMLVIYKNAKYFQSQQLSGKNTVIVDRFFANVYNLCDYPLSIARYHEPVTGSKFTFAAHIKASDDNGGNYLGENTTTDKVAGGQFFFHNGFFYNPESKCFVFCDDTRNYVDTNIREYEYVTIVKTNLPLLTEKYDKIQSQNTEVARKQKDVFSSFKQNSVVVTTKKLITRFLAQYAEDMKTFIAAILSYIK